MTPLCFLDTETDGVHPGRKAWEVAVIRRDDDGEQEFQCFVEIDLSTADLFGLKVGGFYKRHPLGRYLSGHDKDRPEVDYEATQDSGEYLSRYAAACEVARLTHGAHIVGAVPNFDTEVLGTHLRDEGLTPAWHYHLIDVEAMAVGALCGGGLLDGPPLPWKSDDLSQALGVEPPSEIERHTALGDARWAMRLYDAIVGAA